MYTRDDKNWRSISLAIEYIRALVPNDSSLIPFALSKNDRLHLVDLGNIPKPLRADFVNEIERLIAHYKLERKNRVTDARLLKRLKSLIESIDDVIESTRSISDALTDPSGVDAKLYWHFQFQASNAELKKNAKKILIEPFAWFEDRQKEFRNSLATYKKIAINVRNVLSKSGRRRESLKSFYALQVLAAYVAHGAGGMPKINRDDPYCLVLSRFFEHADDALKDDGYHYVRDAVSQFKTLIDALDSSD